MCFDGKNMKKIPEKVQQYQLQKNVERTKEKDFFLTDDEIEIQFLDSSAN